MKKKVSSLICGFLLAVLLVSTDQITKYLARTNLSGKSAISLIPNVFELFYLENRGAAFGMLSNRQWFFVAIAVVMSAAAVYVYLRLPPGRHYRFLKVVCVLVVSGALGNMLDRLFYHYVIDFLYVSLIDFPVFNIADCYICISSALAVIALFTFYRDDDFAFLIPGDHYERGTKA